MSLPDLTASSSIHPGSANLIPSSNITVLIADDDKYNLEIITANLEYEQYKLITARDGAAAWRILIDSPEEIDLVILDRNMPHMNGMEVLAKIKAHQVLQPIPVILQTALASKEDIADGLAAGAFYYLTKPIDSGVLKSVVNTAVTDRKFYKSLLHRVQKESRALRTLINGKFFIRTIEEANDLAAILANACSKPDRVVSGLSELMINAIEHGNLGITYEEKTQLLSNGTWREEIERRRSDLQYADRFAEVIIERHNDEIQITITDQGDGFDWKTYLELTPKRAYDTHGRGIVLASVMSFDKIEFRGTGNQVVVKTPGA